MKKLILFFFYPLFTIHYSPAQQQYGWVDISSHIITPSGTPDLSDVYFIGNEGWITSSNLPEIYHTTDGGATFTIQTTEYPCNAIFMKSNTEGYAGGYSGHVYHTTDGGTSWNFHGTIGTTLLSISFPPSSDTGYCCGYTGKIGRITSSGVSQMTTGFVSNMASITFPTKSEGWVCGEDVIRHYINGTWTADQTYADNVNNGICFVDTHNGWAVGDGGYIIHTTDGAYWTQQQVGSAGLFGVFFLDLQNGWTVGSSGVIYHTSNGGTNWMQEAAGLTTHFLVSVHAVNNQTIYVAGNQKTLLKYTTLTGVEEEGENNFSIYPNPCRDIFTIQFNHKRSVQENIIIINLLGVKVMELTGTGPIQQLNIRDLPAGTYMVLVIDRENRYSGKLIVMK